VRSSNPTGSLWSPLGTSRTNAAMIGAEATTSSFVVNGIPSVTSASCDATGFPLASSAVRTRCAVDEPPLARYPTYMLTALAVVSSRPTVRGLKKPSPHCPTQWLMSATRSPEWAIIAPG
jgi:hypothetical protein